MANSGLAVGAKCDSGVWKSELPRLASENSLMSHLFSTVPSLPGTVCTSYVLSFNSFDPFLSQK